LRSRNEIRKIFTRIEEGHISWTLIRLANISYRGQDSPLGPKARDQQANQEAMLLMREAERAYRDPNVIPEKVS